MKLREVCLQLNSLEVLDVQCHELEVAIKVIQDYNFVESNQELYNNLVKTLMDLRQQKQDLLEKEI